MEGNTDILFYIAGTGEKYETIKSTAGDLSNVFFSGWIDAQKIRALLAEAWAGIVPAKMSDDTAPNKVFEYLSAGLPLISSLEGEIADLIQRHRIGVNYKAGDSEGLYQCIKKLSGDTNIRNDMSHAASFFFKKFGDADRIYDEYANHIEKLAEFKNEFVKSS
jgi:glycosyltransferase involved in cell wall biosynthesis